MKIVVDAEEEEDEDGDVTDVVEVKVACCWAGAVRNGAGRR